MGLVQEFKEFAIKGNAMDLAVGAIIGAAFGKIVASLTDDMIMPPVGWLVSKASGSGLKDLSDKFVSLDGTTYDTLKQAKDAGAPILSYGAFLNTALQFLILAFAVFLIVKAVNSLRRKPEQISDAAPAPTKEETLLTEIRDLLAAGKTPTIPTTLQ
ncbi:MAG: large-conductance mechanosensitive channel protein MscL [Alphaproteobacteria bacterium]|nr:MAG: large-conductance mechanosensitive channel protein MscL [Alphaproteobacteria bacterium]